jgi:hypothetical protein
VDFNCLVLLLVSSVTRRKKNSCTLTHATKTHISYSAEYCVLPVVPQRQHKQRPFLFAIESTPFLRYMLQASNTQAVVCALCNSIDRLDRLSHADKSNLRRASSSCERQIRGFNGRLSGPRNGRFLHMRPANWLQGEWVEKCDCGIAHRLPRSTCKQEQTALTSVLRFHCSTCEFKYSLTNSVALSPRANYPAPSTAACQRS